MFYNTVESTKKIEKCYNENYHKRYVIIDLYISLKVFVYILPQNLIAKLLSQLIILSQNHQK